MSRRDNRVQQSMLDKFLGEKGAADGDRRPGIFLSIFVGLQIVLFILFTDYDQLNGDAFDTDFEGKYGMFQDVHIMIFIGFAFLMCYLQHHGFSSSGFNFLIGATVILWSILNNDFWHQVLGFLDNRSVQRSGVATEEQFNSIIAQDTFTAAASLVPDGKSMMSLYENYSENRTFKPVYLTIKSLITADFTAGAVLISFGAVLGKVNASQLVVLVFLECIFFAINESIGALHFQVVDMGGSIFVHLFGAIFGVAMARVLTTQAQKDRIERFQTSSKYSDLFAMIGTIFLWCFWPSFNGALAEGEGKHRVAINTVIALCGSCIATFILSNLIHRKFSMEEIQNATLAGGVAVGSSADLVVRPWGALLIGVAGGLISTLGFAYIRPFLEKRVGLHDSCGVLHLHGLPAILGAIAGAISAASSTNVNMCTVYASHGSAWSALVSDAEATDSMDEIKALFAAGCEPGIGRTLQDQAGMQMAATALTLLMATVGGLVTGLALKAPFLNPVKLAFVDEPFWEHGDGGPLLDSENGDENETEMQAKLKQVNNVVNGRSLYDQAQTDTSVML